VLFVIGFGLAAGVVVPLLWAFRTTRARFYTREALWPARRALWIRLATEVMTSGLLTVSAVGMLWQRPWAGAVHVLALGMLLYSLLRSLGDSVVRPRWAVIVLTGTLFGGIVSSLVLLGRAGLVIA